MWPRLRFPGLRSNVGGAIRSARSRIVRNYHPLGLYKPDDRPRPVNVDQNVREVLDAAAACGELARTFCRPGTVRERRSTDITGSPEVSVGRFRRTAIAVEPAYLRRFHGARNPGLEPWTSSLSAKSKAYGRRKRPHGPQGVRPNRQSDALTFRPPARVRFAIGLPSRPHGWKTEWLGRVRGRF